MTKLEQKKVTLAGVLVPDQWAEDGEITGFALCTNDEQKYVLHLSDDKSNLNLSLHQSIKVSGIIAGDAGGGSIIVTALRPLSSREIAERDVQGEHTVAD